MRCAAFLAHDADAATALQPTRLGHWTCDLYVLARWRLAARGVGCRAAATTPGAIHASVPIVAVRPWAAQLESWLAPG